MNQREFSKVGQEKLWSDSRVPGGTDRGGNLGGLGDGPPKFEVGDGPCIRPPNILRSSVVGCARKYEKS